MRHRDYFVQSNLRLRTILRLRWIAIFGQLLTVFVVYFGFGFSFPLSASLAVIGFSIAINVILTGLIPNVKVISNQLGAWMLGFDIIQLSALLFLTGGILNPFASLLVAPIAISAASLRTQTTLFLAVMALLATSFISFFYLPLPWYTPEGLALPMAYRMGNWISVLCAMTFIGFFAWQIANESRIMSAALAATEATLAREQKLSEIDGLAAAAAHGLGTPLSTIFLVAKELERELTDESPFKDDILLIRSQAVRCREILQTLTQEGGVGDVLVSSSSIGDFLEEVAQPLKALNANIQIIKAPYETCAQEDEKEPILARNPGMIYALSNLFENAVEFSKNKVVVKAHWNRENLKIHIRDDGNGFSPGMLKKLGEPFVSSRSMAKRRPDDNVQGGMGLGFFISKTLLERSGAVLKFGNNKSPDQGAYVTVVWDRRSIDIGTQNQG